MVLKKVETKNRLFVFFLFNLEFRLSMCHRTLESQPIFKTVPLGLVVVVLLREVSLDRNPLIKICEQADERT